MAEVAVQPEHTSKRKFKVKKNAPVHTRGINELYVDRTTPFPQQLERAWRVLTQGNLDHVVIHAIGPAMQRAINLALQLEARGEGMFASNVTTHTVHLHDDLTPLDDDEVPSSQTRKNSSIAIKVYRTLNVLSNTTNPSDTTG